MSDTIQKELFRLQDTTYRDFQSKLIPTVEKDTIIGVRTPQLRNYARQLFQTEQFSDFLSQLPHRYFDENQLHAFLISQIKDYTACIKEVNRFLPFVDNWATCDQMSPKCFGKHRDELIEEIRKWINAKETYTVRFGIGMLMQFFLDDSFKPEYLQLVASIRSEEYYIRMMVAWYFATALAKQYDAALAMIEKHRLDEWTHNKAIQKAVESSRITREQKMYLKTLKIKP